MNKQAHPLEALAKVPQRTLLAAFSMALNNLHGCLKAEAAPEVVKGCHGIIEEYKRRAVKAGGKNRVKYHSEAFLMQYQLGEVLERYYPEIAGELANA